MGVKIVVDGKMLRVNGEQNLLAVCLSSGLDVPYFCWHPALGSVGSCRQCAVKLFRGPADAAGQVVMACMTRPVIDMRVSIADPEAVAFREAAVEMVLTNHPHDCPVCEVGGECHLQDMAVLTGHHERRYRFAKRTHPNQYLGPFIRQEMNRCIGCYRCVRFYQDYAGGNDSAAIWSRSAQPVCLSISRSPRNSGANGICGRHPRYARIARWGAISRCRSAAVNFAGW